MDINDYRKLVNKASANQLNIRLQEDVDKINLEI